MMPRTTTMYRLVAASCLPTAGLILGATIAFAEPSATGATTAAPPAAAGQWIHVDPQTGKRVPVAPGAALAGRPEFSSSHQGLVEKPAPGGGVMIDLQGRFRHAAAATVGADGKPTVGCVPPGTSDTAGVKP